MDQALGEWVLGDPGGRATEDAHLDGLCLARWRAGRVWFVWPDPGAGDFRHHPLAVGDMEAPPRAAIAVLIADRIAKSGLFLTLTDPTRFFA